ncbi:acyl-CoA N-acyltransferase [Cyathus striatus]|nr:acyl-CoA N-acyltransferase [Cyathus striatus]
MSLFSLISALDSSFSPKSMKTFLPSISSAKAPAMETTSDLRVRLYKNADYEQVRDLYLVAMVYGPDSPARNALQTHPYKPSAYPSYALFLLGVMMLVIPQRFSFLLNTTVSSRPGIAVIFFSIFTFFAYRYVLWNSYVTFFTGCLDKDLKDIAEHYELTPLSPVDSEKSECECILGVEETIRNPAGALILQRVVGCVGIDTTTAPSFAPACTASSTYAELRRMSVSPLLRRRGIAGLLLRTLLGHAKAVGLEKVYLHVTEYQPGAWKMYEKFGWRKQGDEMTEELVDTQMNEMWLDLATVKA